MALTVEMGFCNCCFESDFLLTIATLRLDSDISFFGHVIELRVIVFSVLRSLNTESKDLPELYCFRTVTLLANQ